MADVSPIALSVNQKRMMGDVEAGDFGLPDYIGSATKLIVAQHKNNIAIFTASAVPFSQAPLKTSFCKLDQLYLRLFSSFKATE